MYGRRLSVTGGVAYRLGDYNFAARWAQRVDLRDVEEAARGDSLARFWEEMAVEVVEVLIPEPTRRYRWRSDRLVVTA